MKEEAITSVGPQQQERGEKCLRKTYLLEDNVEKCGTVS
jgi:hypothetical protein